MNLSNSFLKFCEDRDYEINENQINIIQKLGEFHNQNFNKSFFKKIFKEKNNKSGFYLMGDVGVGKTMILNFFYETLKEKKLRLHFNEFMIKFHEFIYENKKIGKDNGLEKFVKNLSSKTKIIYLDEFQVTNIVDAMILGKLFERIFEDNIKVIFSSNTNIKDLYKNGLQREQFTPFIKILENYCTEIELKIDEDYRTSKNTNLNRFLYGSIKVSSELIDFKNSILANCNFSCLNKITPFMLKIICSIFLFSFVSHKAKALANLSFLR